MSGIHRRGKVRGKEFTKARAAARRNPDAWSILFSDAEDQLEGVKSATEMLDGKVSYLGACLLALKERGATTEQLLELATGVASTAKQLDKLLAKGQAWRQNNEDDDDMEDEIDELD